MSEHTPHLTIATLAVRRLANAEKLTLSDEHCRKLARIVIEAIPAKRWFVGMTIDQQEQKAASGLREQGFIVYLPKAFVRYQEGRKIEARSHLRFTGYIFISFDPDRDAYGAINNTGGMDGSAGPALIVNRADRPVPLDFEIVEQLRQIEDEEYARAVARKKPLPRKDLLAGDQVQIIGDRNSPAFGKTGHLLGSHKGLASVLCGMAVWKVPEADLKKVEQPEKRVA
jgi:transcription antitermination factor NusG